MTTSRKILFTSVTMLSLGIAAAASPPLHLSLPDVPAVRGYEDEDEPIQAAAAQATVALPFHYEFRTPGTLEEAPNASLSSSPYFWLNSGGQMILKETVGWTMHGDAPATSKWRKLYAVSNPVDTDNGLHPQNIFRLFTRQKFGNVRQEAYFRITKYNLSASPNRNESNALLLFSRASDSNNLYYAGLRVDGRAVVKKKVNGTYYTMLSLRSIVSSVYDRLLNPNVLPTETWIGVRTDVTNLVGGLVRITVYTDVGRTGIWTRAGEVIDTGLLYGGAPFTADGYSGIRTDFMDARFDDYRLNAISGGIL